MEKYEEKEFTECWKDKMKSLVRKKYNKLIFLLKIQEEEEKVEKDETLLRNRNLQNYHRMQMEIKKQIAEDDFIKNQEDAYKTNIMMQNEQDEFMKYADYNIGEYHKQGKNLIPMILDLKTYKKKTFYG